MSGLGVRMIMMRRRVPLHSIWVVLFVSVCNLVNVLASAEQDRRVLVDFSAALLEPRSSPDDNLSEKVSSVSQEFSLSRTQQNKKITKLILLPFFSSTEKQSLRLLVARRGLPLFPHVFHPRKMSPPSAQESDPFCKGESFFAPSC